MRIFATLVLMSALASTQAASWTVDSLYTYHKTCQDCEVITNPDGLIPASAIPEILAKISLITDFRVRLIVIDTFDKKNDIDSLVEYFLQRIEPSLDNRDRSLTVLYAIGDRLYKWRTGKEARKVLPDSKCEKIAGRIKKELREKKYGEAFVKLFQMVNEPEPIDWAAVISLGFLGVFISVFIGCVVHEHYKSKLLGAKIRTVKDVASSPEKFKIFEEANCIICFEDLDNTGLKKPAHVPIVPDNKNQDQGNAHGPTELMEEKPTPADSERLLPPLKTANKPANLDTLPPKESTFLECGHNFHAGCLKDWMNKNDTCPLCRVRVQQRAINSKPGQENRRDIMLELLNLTHSSFGRDNIYYYYDHGRMIPSSSSSGGSSGGRGFDFGSGGTSGGW